MKFLLLAILPSFPQKFGKNRSYNSSNTAIFENCDFRIHFQDQMIIYFLLPAVMLSLWSKFC